MPFLRRIVSAGLLLTSALAAPSPQASTVSSLNAAPPPEATPQPEVVDLAGQFVSDLIANATQAEEEHLAATRKRLLGCNAGSSLVVDLGYARYKGYADAATGLNYWKGWESLPNILSSHVLTPRGQHPVRCRTHGQPAVETAPIPRGRAGPPHQPGQRLWAHLPAVVPRRSWCSLHPGRRGLPLSQRLRPGRCPEPPRPGLDSRRWLWLWRWQARHDRDHQRQQQGLRRCLDPVPRMWFVGLGPIFDCFADLFLAWCFWFPLLGGSQRQGRCQRWNSRPGLCSRVDQALYLPVWRQPLFRHHLRRVGRWKLGHVPHPCGERSSGVSAL